MPGLFGRTGGGFVPTDVGGAVIWLRSDLGITIVTGVSQWADQSGNGNDLVQATGGFQPSLQSNQINGYPSVRFDGSDDYLTDTFTWNQPEVVYLVFNQISVTAPDTLIDGISPGNLMRIYQADVTVLLQTYAGAVGPALSLATGTWGIIRAVFNGASSSIRLNNGAPVTGNVGANNAGGLSLGAYMAGPSQFGNVEFAEVIGYNAVPSSVDDSLIMNYLNGRYSIY